MLHIYALTPACCVRYIVITPTASKRPVYTVVSEDHSGDTGGQETALLCTAAGWCQ